MIDGDYLLQPKGLKLIRDHFKERLLERYNIVVDDTEYTCLCNPEYVQKFFRGTYRKNGSKTIGYLKIKDVEVIVLYQNDSKDDTVTGKFVTCYPIDADKSDMELMRVCFGKREILKFAMVCYKRFEYELLLFKQQNISELRDVGKHLFVDSEYCFPQPLMEVIKYGNYDKWMLCRKIRDVIFDYHPFVELVLHKRKTHKKAPQ